MFAAHLRKAILTLASVGLWPHLCNGFQGQATWYRTGYGSCGGSNQDGDFIAALSTAEYNGVLTAGNVLWSSVYEGRSVEVTIVDSCPGCGENGLDLSPAAFEALAPSGAGRIDHIMVISVTQIHDGVASVNVW
ncbi:RlpA-like double-psi beta-barrel-protein domain-containing protein-containing protein [Infundibulicybe gibba]|nr:RlpA-like double-psi beta-barrel-protein domain-containing protein-containing protein [Infundibulicybe gibba]